MCPANTPVEGVYEKNPGSGIWYVRYRVNGKLVRKAIGKRQAAIDHHRKVKVLLRSGEGFVPDTAKESPKTDAQLAREAVQGITLGELCDDLLKQIQRNPERYKDQRNPPQRIGLIKQTFGNRVAEGIKTYEVADWLEGLGLSPASHDRYKAVFSAIFKYGKARSKLTVNPVRDVEPRRIDNGIIRYLKPAEEVRLRAILQADVDACGPQNEQLKKHMLHRIYELDVALSTGMRKSEQYGVTWPDIDFHAKTITLRDTKNGQSRIVHMNADTVAAMKGLKSLGLIRKRREEGRPNNSHVESVFGIGDNKRWWVSALRRAKISNFRWHDLRHTFCSRLAQKGVSLKVIQDLAGHKTIAMTARYAHLDDRTLKNAIAPSLLNRSKGRAVR